MSYGPIVLLESSDIGVSRGRPRWIVLDLMTSVQQAVLDRLEGKETINIL